MVGDVILIVDDDPKAIESLRLALDVYHIVQAPSGEEALKILEHPNDVDMVILDVHMSGMSGTDALTEIKRIRPDLGVIIMTGYGSRDVLVRALRGRADEYLEKPFDIEELQKKVAGLLDERPREEDAQEERVPRHIARIKKLIDRNYDKRISLKDATATVSLNPKYLSRVFKKQTGMKFTEYRLAVKVRAAKSLLERSTCDIAQIAAKLGYENGESFMKMFKKVCGLTPTEYRRLASSERG